jgi:hypothetical protein
MRIFLGGLLLLAFSSPALAQPTELRRELARASFLVGEWEGQGWMKIARDDQPLSGVATVEGRPRLLGLSLGWKRLLRAERGLVSESDVSLRFRRDSTVFRAAFYSLGYSVRDGWARVGECEASWGLPISGAQPDAGDHIRYTMRVDAENRLTEIGERSDDGGRTWWQFYGAEMAGKSGDGCRAPAVPEPARTGGER